MPSKPTHHGITHNFANVHGYFGIKCQLFHRVRKCCSVDSNSQVDFLNNSAASAHIASLSKQFFSLLAVAYLAENQFDYCGKLWFENWTSLAVCWWWQTKGHNSPKAGAVTQESCAVITAPGWVRKAWARQGFAASSQTAAFVYAAHSSATTESNLRMTHARQKNT